MEFLLMKRGEFFQTVTGLGVDGVALGNPVKFNSIHRFPV
jgi:hypothetical protein